MFVLQIVLQLPIAFGEREPINQVAAVYVHARENTNTHFLSVDNGRFLPFVPSSIGFFEHGRNTSWQVSAHSGLELIRPLGWRAASIPLRFSQVVAKSHLNQGYAMKRIGMILLIGRCAVGGGSAAVLVGPRWQSTAQAETTLSQPSLAPTRPCVRVSDRSEAVARRSSPSVAYVQSTNRGPS